MKQDFLRGLGLFLLFFLNTVFGNDLSAKNESEPSIKVSGDTIFVGSAPELTALAKLWILEYGVKNPSVKISFNENQGNNAHGVYFMMEDYSSPVINESSWKIRLGHQVIVPVVNATNPMLNEILHQGISKSEFARLLSGSGKVNWSDLITNGEQKPVNCFLSGNTSLTSALARYSETEPLILKPGMLLKAGEFIAAVQKDPYAIGFCNLADIKKPGLNELKEDIILLPIDKNGNSRIDYFESIYGTPDDLSRGAWVGKYPHELSGNFIASAQTKPTDENVLAFLTWITMSGGQSLAANGYSELINLERQSNLASLSISPSGEIAPVIKGKTAISWVITLSLAIASGFLFLIAVWFFARVKSPAGKDEMLLTSLVNENIMHSPEGLFFDKTHTWTYMEKDGLIRVGIDDFLQQVTGTITRVIMKKPGETIRRGEKILTLSKFGKQLNLYSPVSGTIRAQNLKLHENSSLVNKSPYGDGWIYLVEPGNWLREIQFMWMGEKHREWLKDEYTRLRNFFKESLNMGLAGSEYPILQDGGELRNHLLADSGPEIWEEFQEKFIDPSR
jgi:glycine cleavage system H lipoate-binding protein/ABC-type phosphate transport system substrate-binding protein